MQTPACISLSAVPHTTIPLMIHKALSGLQDGREVSGCLVLGYSKLSNRKLEHGFGYVIKSSKQYEPYNTYQNTEALYGKSVYINELCSI
jgi:hypothetical protein